MNCKQCGKQKAFADNVINCHTDCPVYAANKADQQKARENRAKASVPYSITAESRKRSYRERRYW